tara:strand:- start:162 stop:491 length:330 start_codon:yes stop_codon:yes gene_type:complete
VQLSIISGSNTLSLFFVLFFVWAGGMKFYHAWCVGQKLDVPLSYFFKMASGPEMNRMYSGAEVFAVNLIYGGIIHFIGALWMFMLWTLLRPIHKHNKLLLHYIDKEQNR